MIVKGYPLSVYFQKQIIRLFSPGNLKNWCILHPPLPTFITIDPSTICNLHCPLCPTGNRTLRLPPKFLSLKEFQTILSHAPSVNEIFLYNWGEPFLNPVLIDLIRHAKSKKITVHINSNLSLPLSDKKIKQIIGSGLDELRVSLDGASTKTYSIYRVGGNFDMVISNIKRLVAQKNRTPASNLTIVWNYLVHKNNISEIPFARRMARRLGIPIHFDKFGLGDDIPDLDVTPHQSLDSKKSKWLPKTQKYLMNRYRSGSTKALSAPVCHWPFDGLVVSANGDVLPCCYCGNSKSSFGNLQKQTLEKLWYSSIFQYTRSLFYPRINYPKKFTVACQRCPFFQGKAT